MMSAVGDVPGDVPSVAPAECTGEKAAAPADHVDDEAAVERFRDFLRIRSISGEGPRTGSYQQAADWLAARGRAIGLSVDVISPIEGKPIVLMAWSGDSTDLKLESLILNSHYDVVPVMDEHWTCDPFGAVMKPNGDIYGRGTQDMKSVCVQYLEAIARLIERGVTPARRVYLTFVPDEEIGGVDGMGALLKTAEFAAMQPVGLVLDEGLASTTDKYTLFYGERTPWWVMVQARGPTGHGSRFIKGTAVSKLIRVANKALEFRQEQEDSLGHDKCGCKHGMAKKLGDVTTLNLTMLKAGVSSDGGATWALNVIPTEAEAGMDIRISPSMKVSDVVAKLDEWTAEDGLSWSTAPGINCLHEHHITSLDEAESPWAAVFKRAAETAGIQLEPEIFPAATDSRFVRQLGLAAFGFSPMANCPILLHEHNEYIPRAVFTRGIRIYETLLEALIADAPEHARHAAAVAKAETAASAASGDGTRKRARLDTTAAENDSVAAED